MKHIEKIKRPMIERGRKIPVVRDILYPIGKIKKRFEAPPSIATSSKYGAIYFRINKVASTSIKSSLLKLGFKIKNSRDPKKLDLKKYKIKFAFVRNPYDRLVSCYRDKIRSPSEFGVIAADHKRLYEDMPFNEFVRKVHKIPDNKADKHFKSQHCFVTNSKGKLIPNFIGKFENLDEDFKKIMNRLQVENPPALPQKNKSKRAKDYRKYYDDETKRLVEQRYKKDLELFNYEF